MSRVPSAGLYVHLPFCASRCSYCDFLSGFDADIIPDYIDLLLREAELTRQLSSHWKNETFDTIYLGGGTPSWLGATHLAKLLAGLRRRLSVNPDCESTIECNPSDIYPELLDILSESGINRLSLGVQSFEADELRLLDRRHDGDKAIESMACIREHAPGFSLNVDLMHALPGQNLESLGQSLNLALDFAPEHLSCYALTLAPETRLAKCLALAHAQQDEDQQIQHYLFLEERLEAAGYEHYEVSNYARPGRRSRHNQKYWSRSQVLALGCGAHGFDGRTRYRNFEVYQAYREALSAGLLPILEQETLSREQCRLEAISLGFRTRDGLALSWIPTPNQQLDRLLHEGLITIERDRVRPTQRGMLLADGLAARLA